MISNLDLIALSRIPGVGSNRLRALVSRCMDAHSPAEISVRELAGAEGFSKILAGQVVAFVKDSRFEEAKRYAEKQLSRLDKIHGTILTFWDPRYPELLRSIYDPPPYLYVLGEPVDQDRFALAIVGTRSPSEYGKMMAEKFSEEFARLGITVTSGLARGIDTVAHAASLKSSGRTIAVIGSGLDVVYPPENRNLLERIAGQGAVLSEYEMGARPDAVNFPRRNRIISGLSLGTLVVETGLTGGAMITASMALDQNREVFAVPSNVSAGRNRGCNALIKDGRAKLVESIEDILQELSAKLHPLVNGSSAPHRAPPADLTLFEQLVHDHLDDHPCHIDSLAEKSGMPASDVLVHALSLEFKGLVQQLPGKMFIRR